jgi:hypothetical protein
MEVPLGLMLTGAQARNIVIQNCRFAGSRADVVRRTYPNNPLYCVRLQSPMPALSAKNLLNVEQTRLASLFDLAPWPEEFSLGLITRRLFG